MFAVIMAGGAGKRFWPLSRIRRPKQLLNIMGRETLLKQTVDRLEPLVSHDRILVVTGKDHHKGVLDDLPLIPPANVIPEPEGKNTAACLALGAVIVKSRDPDAVMALLPADHHIKNGEVFRKTLQAAGRMAREGEYLVTLGIKPSRPESGYGYILKGEPTRPRGGFEVHKAARFVEKPDARQAEAYIRGGEHLWNSGIFILTVSTAYSLIKLHMPQLYAGMLEMEGTLTEESSEATISRVYKELESVSIDYGVAEKASDVYVIPSDFGWSDVGSWGSLFELLPKDEGNNVLMGNSLSVDTANTLLHSSNKLVVAIGLENMVVIESADAILICPMDRDQDIKKLVELMEDRGMSEYL